MSEAKEETKDKATEPKNGAERPVKKRKTEPEVTIAPTGPGGPDVSLD